MRRQPSWKTVRNRYARITQESQTLADAEKARNRLFAGVFPCGIVYADKGRAVAGDYARLAFLPYRELEVQFERDCPAAFRAVITADAAKVIARRGEQFEVSTCGQTVTLGKG
jgi:hypothetical protein